MLDVPRRFECGTKRLIDCMKRTIRPGSAKGKPCCPDYPRPRVFESLSGFGAVVQLKLYAWPAQFITVSTTRGAETVMCDVKGAVDHCFAARDSISTDAFEEDSSMARFRTLFLITVILGSYVVFAPPNAAGAQSTGNAIEALSYLNELNETKGRAAANTYFRSLPFGIQEEVIRLVTPVKTAQQNVTVKPAENAVLAAGGCWSVRGTRVWESPLGTDLIAITMTIDWCYGSAITSRSCYSRSYAKSWPWSVDQIHYSCKLARGGIGQSLVHYETQTTFKACTAGGAGCFDYRTKYVALVGYSEGRYDWWHD